MARSRQAAPLPDLLRWLEAASVPGLAAVVVEKGKQPQFHTGGTTHAGGGRPITPETVFAAASLSKQLVAYAALDLEAKGLLDLNRPFGEYAPVEGSPDAGKVTARLILSHSTGFPNWRFKAGDPLTPSAEPGKTFRYSGEGYVYLQRVIEKITAKPFGRAMHELVLDPLGMKSSTFTWRVLNDRALPHNRQGEQRTDAATQIAQLDKLAKEWNKDPEDWTVSDLEKACAAMKSDALPNNYAINAAASLLTSAQDYARFLQAAMKRPRFGEKQVTVHGTLGWGLGWGLEDLQGSTWWWQWGDNGGYKNFVLLEPNRGYAIAVFTNGDKGRAVYERVIRAAAGFDPAAFLWL